MVYVESLLSRQREDIAGDDVKLSRSKLRASHDKISLALPLRASTAESAEASPVAKAEAGCGGCSLASPQGPENLNGQSSKDKAEHAVRFSGQGRSWCLSFLGPHDPASHPEYSWIVL